jgi:MFS family permease
MTCFIILADVATDTMCVERSKLESEQNRGSFQATGYSFRALGMFLGAVGGTAAYSSSSSSSSSSAGLSLSIAQIFLLNAIFPLLVVLPLCFPLVEIIACAPASLAAQLSALWRLVARNAVWVPVMYIFFYNSMQIPNQAWNNFLLDGLRFSTLDLGLISVLAALTGWVGLILFKLLFFHTNWRLLFVTTTVLNAGFSMLQLVLIERINASWGLSDLAFAVGEEASSKLINSSSSPVLFVVLSQFISCMRFKRCRRRSCSCACVPRGARELPTRC